MIDKMLLYYCHFKGRGFLSFETMFCCAVPICLELLTLFPPPPRVATVDVLWLSR